MIKEKIKIHYINRHGTTNISWQSAFKKLGNLSLGNNSLSNFPNEIDHLHLGGSCKGRQSNCKNPITVDIIKDIQKKTGCSISVFFGDAVETRFKFHHKLLDSVPKVKVYSAALYGTSMWRDDINWVLHPTDEELFYPVKHKLNSTVLFCGHLTPYRKKIIEKLHKADIKVDVVGKNGSINPIFGRELTKFSKNYLISFGMVYEEQRPKNRYSSSRLPNALAMDLIYIETNFNLKNVFEKDEIIQWNNIDDLIDKIKYFQKNPEEGLNIIEKGRKKVFNNWTFKKLASRFINES